MEAGARVSVSADPPLSLGPASRLLGVDPDTLRRWADEGRVEAFLTPGGHRRFEREALERVLRTRPARGGPPLASLGATPDRLSRAYRRDYAAPSGRDVRQAIPATDREAWREGGRALVGALLAHLDAADDAERDRAEAAATALTEDLARRLAVGGTALPESIALFVAARRPFLAELGAIGRRRSLDPERLSSLYDASSALLDRLLLRLIESHEAATALAAPRRRLGR